jgi:hypothetical protein
VVLRDEKGVVLQDRCVCVWGGGGNWAVPQHTTPRDDLFLVTCLLRLLVQVLSSTITVLHNGQGHEVVDAATLLGRTHSIPNTHILTCSWWSCFWWRCTNALSPTLTFLRNGKGEEQVDAVVNTKQRHTLTRSL